MIVTISLTLVSKYASYLFLFGDGGFEEHSLVYSASTAVKGGRGPPPTRVANLSTRTTDPTLFAHVTVV